MSKDRIERVTRVTSSDGTEYAVELNVTKLDRILASLKVGETLVLKSEDDTIVLRARRDYKSSRSTE